MTLVFPSSLSPNSPQTAPLAHNVPLPQNLSVQSLPSTSNALSPISQDSSLAFSVPYDEAAEFLMFAQEIPNAATIPGSKKARKGLEAEPVQEEKRWIMKAAKTNNTISIRRWAMESWTSFVDLLKVRATNYTYSTTTY